jgi:hypothetical protein
MNYSSALGLSELLRKLSRFSPLLILLPSFAFGSRSIYFFEFVPLFAIALLGIMGKARVRWLPFLYLIVLLVLITVMSIGQILLYGGVQSWAILRILNLVILFLVFSSLYSNVKELQGMVVLAISVAVGVAYLQMIDNFAFQGILRINEIVAFLYPYRGDLGERGLAITGGLSLKTNSVLSPTSIGAGHTIIAGNLFAVMAITLLFWQRLFLFSLCSLLTFVTFSRGSWLFLLIGIVIFVFFILKEMKKSSMKNILKILFVFLGAGLVLYLSPFYQYAIFRIENTLFVFGLIDSAVGNQIDPRTSVVWPDFIDAMNAIGYFAWLFGSDLNIPTDSGWLLIFRDNGLIGFVAFILLLGGLYLGAQKDRLVTALLIAFIIASIVNPVHQGYQLLFLVVIVAVIQRARHLTNHESIVFTPSNEIRAS